MKNQNDKNQRSIDENLSTEFNSKKKKNSEVWKFFSQDSQDFSKAICQVKIGEKTISNENGDLAKIPIICGAVVSRGGKIPTNFTTCGLKKHLERKHPDINQKLTEIERSKSPEDLNSLEKKNDQPLQKKITLFMNKPIFEQGFLTQDIKNKIERSIAEMIYLDFRPFSIVEDEGFQGLIKILYPGYKVPHRTHFSKKIIPLLYEMKINKAKQLVLNYQRGRYGLTTDSWESLAGDHYLR